MRRLSFIYSAAPLTVALSTLPNFVDGMWRIALAGVIAIALWAVTWARVYSNKKLRPEFAILVIIPAMCHHLMQAYGPEYTAAINTPAWQNFNFILWIAAIVVTIRALLPTSAEYKGRLAADSVLIFMSLITVAYNLSCWMTSHNYLITNQQ